MSWIVQSLIMNREVLKEEKNIESDEFNDLLMVERAIHELEAKGLLTEDDMQIIGVVSGYVDESSLGMSKETFNKRFSIICERIAYSIGGYFTDEGFLAYMKNKHKLSEEKVQKMRDFIKSPYKHKISRKSTV